MSNLCSLNFAEWGQKGDVPVHSATELRLLLGECFSRGESDERPDGHEQASTWHTHLEFLLDLGEPLADLRWLRGEVRGVPWVREPWAEARLPCLLLGSRKLP